MTKTKTLVISLLIAMQILVAAGCSESQNSGPADTGRPADNTDTSEALNDTENGSTAGEQTTEGQEEHRSETETAADFSEKRILIAYFSWAENTTPQSPDDADIDALTSASLISPGNTGHIAQLIQDSVGGELFPIMAAQPYPDDLNQCAARAGEELAADARPELTGSVGNIEEYDMIFLGYPIWNNTCPMAVLTFIEQHDLTDKTIALFSAFGGGGIEQSISDIKATIPDESKVLEPAFGASRGSFANVKANTEAWLAELSAK